jgi:SAM-dependent methyltransferase
MENSYKELQEYVDLFFSSKKEPLILEAGCGSASHLQFPSDANIVGIDISQKQLDRNQHLYEKILGDIQVYQFPDHKYDVIICWDVLEHLFSPDMAIDKFLNAVKENGIIILKCPNVYSFKGLVTKYTPHRIHVWFYRLLGFKDAGKNDVGPFKTFLRFSISPKSIKTRAQKQNYQVDLIKFWDVSEEGNFLRDKKIVFVIYELFFWISKVLSMNFLGKSEYYCIIKFNKAVPI